MKFAGELDKLLARKRGEAAALARALKLTTGFISEVRKGKACSPDTAVAVCEWAGSRYGADAEQALRTAWIADQNDPIVLDAIEKARAKVRQIAGDELSPLDRALHGWTHHHVSMLTTLLERCRIAPVSEALGHLSIAVDHIERAHGDKVRRKGGVSGRRKRG